MNVIDVLLGRSINTGIQNIIQLSKHSLEMCPTKADTRSLTERSFNYACCWCKDIMYNVWLQRVQVTLHLFNFNFPFFANVLIPLKKPLSYILNFYIEMYLNSLIMYGGIHIQQIQQKYC